MRRVIILHWKAESLQAIVLRGSSSSQELEAVVDVPQQDSTAETGRILAEKLANFSPNRAQLAVAVSRDNLRWQHLSLPPCPMEELPDLVRLQSDYSSNGSDDLAGLDFLPLSGDENTPHRVWIISVSPTHLGNLRKVLSTADLEPSQVVPAVLGWPHVLTHTREQGNAGTIFVAPLEEEAAIWGEVAGRVVTFRQLHLPDSTADHFSSTVIAEVKRTLLAFGQEHTDDGDPKVAFIDNCSSLAQDLIEALRAELRQDITPLQSGITLSPDSAAGSIPQSVCGIAASVLSGTSPHVDLLHPRERPAPKTRLQTYYLAATAVLALALLIAWKGFRDLQAPLERAAVMQAEIDLREENKDVYATAEKEAAAIRAWQAKSVNLLEELRIITRHVRSEPLDSENFPEDDDVVIGKMELRGRQFTITAYTKQNSDLRPVEYRLRDGTHRVRRGATERTDEVSGYPVKFESIVDVLSGAETAKTDGGNP